MNWKRRVTLLWVVIMLAWAVMMVTPLYQRWLYHRWLGVVPFTWSLWTFYDMRTDKRHRHP